MTSQPKKMLALWFFMVFACLFVGCATTNDIKPAREAGGAPDQATPAPGFTPVTFNHVMSPVGDMLRLFGEQVGGGVVLMSGLEERAADEVSFRDMPYQEAVSRLAGAIDCVYLHTPHYYFILPDGYEALRTPRVRGALDARYQEMTASVAFGAKTNLYQVFSALGRNLEITVVADNFIAEARCGELFLNNAPLAVIIDAILKSARFTADAVTVESTPEYIFIRAPQNTAPDSLLLNAASLDAEQHALLERKVNLVLPDQRIHAFVSEAISLHDALTPLTMQLGVEIVAQRQLADIPVNPCAMHQVRMSTALNLLLRQWPLPEFGYEVQPNRILIRER